MCIGFFLFVRMLVLASCPEEFLKESLRNYQMCYPTLVSLCLSHNFKGQFWGKNGIEKNLQRLNSQTPHIG